MVISENALFREGLRHLLGTAPDLDVLGAVSSLAEAVQREWHIVPDVVVVDGAADTPSGRAMLIRLLDLDVKQVITVTMDDRTITVYSDATTVARCLPDASADTLLDLLADDS